MCTLSFAVQAEEAPGYVQYVQDGGTECESNLDYAYEYIDGYADAIQADEAVDKNIDAAVKEVRKEVTPFYASIWSILPAIIAIVLALITKEVYSSLFVGILAGGLLYANFNFETTFNHVIQSGFVASLSDPYNVGILIFLVLLGTLVAMMNKAGGSAAFGRWASTHIKSRVGAQLATILLGVLIFVDDYFNCLTVGSVMRPVADAKKISRAKLSYLIDATAAPVCIIAPISSWAAAVAGFAPDGQGIGLFIRAIPYNFYAILTIVMMVTIAIMKFDFGPMKLHEKNAQEKGDIFTVLEDRAVEAETKANQKGKVIDLILPVVILIISCILGMIYSGGFFDGETFVNAFSNCDASVGLALGSFASIILVSIYFIVFRRGVIKFTDLMGCIPEGFKAMVPAILILTCAWTLKGMTDSIGAKIFIANFVNTSASSFVDFLPAIIFLVAIGLSFSTGTSWGTFGILIPIVLAIFPEGEIAIIGMSACMAGAVCGDHCSPISDTTIMASAGAQCNHIAHVSTQLPYAMTVAGISFVMYIVAGFVQNWFIVLPLGIAVTIGTLFAIKAMTKKA
ncbi:MAG: Na+/H+ antiporter NhaC family protein [Clostridia bacterium]|nr:Na+/H+ antiporter NhaC family protein [Clostridia bacterium]